MTNGQKPSNGARETSRQSSRELAARAVEWLGIFQEQCGRELSAQLTEIYIRALSDLTPDELERGSLIALRTCEFFPRVSQILAAAKPATTDAAQLETETAWEKISKADRGFLVR